MEKKLISNKALIFKIVSAILIVSFIVLFISTKYLKETAIHNLASDDAKKTAQLVFETMNTRMQEGWGKDDLNKIIGRLENIREGMSIASYRSEKVSTIFGVIEKDKKTVENDILIQKAMAGKEILSVDNETGMVRFLYPMHTSTECKSCHINTKEGDINGVLDISFPHNDIKISLDNITIYFIVFFIFFLVIFAIIFFFIINKKMLIPMLSLTKDIEAIEKSKCLTQRVDINTNIKELRILQNSFNKLLTSIKFYYDKLIENIYIDTLTKLPNLTKLQEDILKCNDTQSLLKIDINSFGKINRVYGIKVADTILQNFSSQVKKLLGEDGKIYRIYAAEFIIIYNGKLSKTDIKNYIKNFKKSIFKYKDIEFTLDITVGYVNNIDDKVLENASIALKSAKSQKKSIVIFNKDIELKDEDNYHIKWSNILNQSIKEDKVIPVFMPMKCTKTDKIVKYECLIRIKDGDTIYTPDKFLDVAIASGRYHTLTQIMIVKIFEYFKDISNLKFSINFSLSDILDEETMNILFDNLEKYKYSHNVVIELLETEEISDFKLLNKFINKVKSYNAKIAIDDFGSGYSNFNYILNMDIDIIKLDSSLVKNVFTDQNSAMVVATLVSLAHEMKLEVVAEMVSNEKIENILTNYGVDYLQGFYIGKPQLDILEEKDKL
ncbi:MAG: EAL domain-containing protein [Campylobacterota bacterium]|nr:EAL domain-containing protein [Campylobacterota bacterium]